MESLIGTWRLVSWTADVDGHSLRPFGGETTGLISYTEDGRMWGTLMRSDREQLSAPTLAAATEADRARAAAGYLNYAGTYRVEPGRVVHQVEVSLYPNWIGTEQVREMEWEPNPAGGQDLILSAAATQPDGRVVSNRLVWRRLEDWA